MLTRRLSRMFGKQKLFIWNKSGLSKSVTNMSEYINGEVKSVSMGPNHSGIVTKCGKLYMFGIHIL